MTVYEPPEQDSLAITVSDLVADPALELRLKVLAGHAGLGRQIAHPRVQKSGLVLVGHARGLVPTRVQVLGETELSFAEALGPDGQEQAARHLFGLRPACVLVSRGAEPPLSFQKQAEASSTPLLVCEERSSVAITALHTVLDERLAPRTTIHGVLMDVFEVGVLLLGKSGIGKSECALELLMRGHRLVADDIVECDFRPPGMVFGEAPELLRDHMEVRGLGVLNIKDLYGVTAIRKRKRIDLIIELELWEPEASYDRLGLESHERDILGVPVRRLLVPVRVGRDMSSIIEIAARNELLRKTGRDPAREFIERVERERGAVSATQAEPSHVFNALGAEATESSAPPPVKARRAPGRPRTP